MFLVSQHHVIARELTEYIAEEVANGRLVPEVLNQLSNQSYWHNTKEEPP